MRRPGSRLSIPYLDQCLRGENETILHAAGHTQVTWVALFGMHFCGERSSLVPRPHPLALALRGKRGLVNLDTILGPGKGI